VLELLVLRWEEKLKVFGERFGNGATGFVVVLDRVVGLGGGPTCSSWAYVLR